MSKNKKRKNNHLPKNQSNTNSNLTLSRSLKFTSFSGPIPPPKIMEEYNALMPEATKKFFELAEGQSKHRQDIEKTEVAGQNKRATLGLFAAWSLSVILCLIAAFLLYHDKNIAAYVSLALGTLPRFTSLILARYDRKKQVEKSKDMSINN